MAGLSWEHQSFQCFPSWGQRRPVPLHSVQLPKVYGTFLSPLQTGHVYNSLKHRRHVSIAPPCTLSRCNAIAVSAKYIAAPAPMGNAFCSVLMMVANFPAAVRAGS